MSTYKGYIDLFPTRIHKIAIDQKIIKSLAPFDDSKNITDVSKDVRYKLLNENVLKEVSNICPKHEMIGDWKIVGSWINNQPTGKNGFGFHSHSDSFMSCVLYLQGKKMSLVLKETARQSYPSDSTADNYFDIVVRHSWHPEISIPVEVGDLIVFPSYQIHKSNDNDEDVDRISIAYNLMPSKIKSQKSFPWTMEFN
tara:strand:- start:59 stop:649 length:591 start_codon:yes stop_codon:yes gene_type:complete